MLRRIHPLRALATLVIFAGAIGLAQIPVPARHAWLSDFVIDALAACAGTGAAFVIGKLGRPGDDRPEGVPGSPGVRMSGCATQPPFRQVSATARR
jgi:hypothetical protein